VCNTLPLNFKAVSWNANGLNSHLDELLYYLENNNDLPDFICIQETWVYSQYVPIIEGYYSTHTFRKEKKGGGSVIYIKKNIKFNVLDTIEFNDVDIEVAGIIFMRNNLEIVTLMSVYIAPNQIINTEHLNKLITHKNVILLGDFNAKNKLWGSPVNDMRGQIVENFMEENNLICINNGEGTHLNYNGTVSHLDLVLCSNNISLSTECRVLKETWGSDHFPLEVVINGKDIRAYNNLCYNHNFKLVDWTKYQSYLTNETDFNQEIHELNHDFEKFRAKIIKARENSIPRRNFSFKHKYTPFWNRECSEAKSIKKKAAKELRKNNNQLNIDKYKQSKKKFKELISKSKQNH